MGFSASYPGMRRLNIKKSRWYYERPYITGARFVLPTSLLHTIFYRFQFQFQWCDAGRQESSMTNHFVAS